MVGLQPLRGDRDIFCHGGSGRVGRVWSAREKSLEILRRGRELNPGHREDRQRDSFSHWAIMTQATERTDSEIHSFSHWATKARATRRTDSEIHSFSHWAIKALVMRRTGNEIHSFSHWAIMTGYITKWLRRMILYRTNYPAYQL